MVQLNHQERGKRPLTWTRTGFRGAGLLKFDSLRVRIQIKIIGEKTQWKK